MTNRLPLLASAIAALIALVALAPSASADQSFFDSMDFSQAQTPAQLQTLVAPVALYPDPVLAQILQASTYPDQVSQAALEVQMNPGQSVDSEQWDASVVAVAHYPPVIGMMAKQISWTTKLGQAYLSQQGAVLQAVQALRAQAKNMGNLKTTSQQQVVAQDNYIQIIPVSPETVYVPEYDPVVVYNQPAVWGTPLIGFGAGWAVGTAMSTTTVDWIGGTVVNYPPGYGWQNAYYNGGHGVVAGQTANGTAYAGQYGSKTLANGATVGGYRGAAVGPNGAATGRGWNYSNGSNQAGGFSRTVDTDNGVYNVHGAGAETSQGTDGYVTATKVSPDGQTSSTTYTDHDGDISSSDLRGDSAFSEAHNDDWDSANADRGAWSRGAYADRGDDAPRYGGGLGEGGFRGGGGFRR